MGDRRASVSFRNPAQIVLAAFVVLILLGTLLLLLPAASDPGRPALGWRDALFTSTSASTVTGLLTIDITHLSLFGELVVLGLIQVGGFGIMTVGSVVALTLLRRIGLRQRMLARAEIGAVDIGELRSLIRAIATITIVTELVLAAILVVPFVRSDMDIGAACYHAVFHAVSAWNNAGISLYPDSLTRYVGDPMVVFPVTFAFIGGGLGFPVLVELLRRVSPRRWSLHMRITLAATAVMLLIGPLTVLVFEWNNPATLSSFDIWEKLQAAWFQGVTPRTAGFNTIDIGELEPQTLLTTTGLMFIGAGPASTSGGIKVTTFAVLAFAMWSVVRGDDDVTAARRRIPADVVRQAMAVAFLAIALVFGGTLALISMTDFEFLETAFEVTSAFGTVGLSTGLTAALPASAQLLLVVIMLAGRVGPITFVAALALRQRTRTYRYARERPIIG